MRQWLVHPVTKRLMEVLEHDRMANMDMWANNGFEDRDHELVARGECIVCEALIRMNPDYLLLPQEQQEQGDDNAPVH